MAITIGENSGFTALPFTGAGGTRTMATACAPGDLIMAYLGLSNASTNATPVLNDGVNTGSYLLLGLYYDVANNRQTSLYYKVCNASGTPAVATGSLAGLGGGCGGSLGTWRWTGFTGTTSIDTNQTQQTTGSIAGIVGPALNTGFNPELLVAINGGTAAFHISSNTSGWLTLATGPGTYGYYKIDTTAPPIAEQYTNTADGITNWVVLTGGFLGAAPSSPVYSRRYVRFDI